VKNYYSILGVSSTASEHEIKRAYRRLAVQYHPDKNTDPQAENYFKEINEAYEVIGDSAKRFNYDQRIANPFADVIVEEAPKHRDPAYRRSKASRPSPKPKESDSYLFLKQYQPYYYWICIAGVVFTSLLFIDYVLPLNETSEHIIDTRVVRERRNGVAYFNAFTESGKKIKFYSAETPLEKEADVRLGCTRIFATPIWVSRADGSEVTSLGHMYHKFVFMPVLLFIFSVAGMLFKKRIEFCFNCSFVAAVMFIIYYVFV
jgi:curved DNA-binding protein CbpA